MGVLVGLDADVWVSASPSITIGGTPEACSNTDSGLWITYQANVHKYWDKRQTLTVQVGTDEKQTLTVTGSPTGGTVKLAFNGQIMAGTLPWNATAAQVKTALEGLSTIGANNTICTGGSWPATPIVVEFVGAHGGEVEPLISLNTNSLTGGTSPTVTFVHTQNGIAWATNTANKFRYVGGIITFTPALVSTQVVQISAGYYFNVSQLTDCHEWSLDMKADSVDTSIFQGSGWGAFTGTQKTAAGKISSFRVDDFLALQLTNLMIFSLYVDKSVGTRWECAGYLISVNPKTSMAGVVEQDVAFITDGEVFYYAS